MGNRVVNIEYYATCPACGAASGNSDTCEYCGASLIKNRVIENFAETSLEDKNAMEDMGIPVVHGKSCEMNKELLLFSIFFGGMFISIPTVIFIVFIAVGMFFWPMIFFFAIFWVIGSAAIVPVFSAAKNRKKCKNGKVVTGELRGYEDSMVTMNGKAVLNMRILFDDGFDRKIVLIGTGDTVKRYPIGATMRFRNHEKYYLLDMNY